MKTVHEGLVSFNVLVNQRFPITLRPQFMSKFEIDFIGKGDLSLRGT